MNEKFVNKDLLKERNRATFNITELTNLLDGSKEKTSRRKVLESIYYNDPEFRDEVPLDYLTRSEVYEDSLRKFLHVFNKTVKSVDHVDTAVVAVVDAMLKEVSPLTAHFVMFIPSLMGLSNEEQQARWLPNALKMKIIGTYAQTELGHGTFLRGLETTATYDEETNEFVLNSPNLTSTKWWPGGLGKTANFAIVQAQLYIKGKCYGLHPFMVQIRSTEDHQPLPGITVGEIGPKVGYRTTDNGFLKLNMIRIPRENMLMKNAEVTKEGKYIKPISDKLNYRPMVFTRVLVLHMVADNVAKVVTIAMRYNAIRRQAVILLNEPEVQILDYQSQQYKLLPVVAFSHACKAMFVAVMDTYKSTTQDLEKGNLQLLPELHATSCGLKAFCTEIGSHYIDMCQESCGSHGFLMISGIPRIRSATIAACTYEGENTVLYLQTASYLMKCVNEQQLLLKNSFFWYLRDHDIVLRPSFDNQPTFQQLLTCYKLVAQKMVYKASSRLQQLIDAGNVPEVAWNLNQVDLINSAKAHTHYYMAQRYINWVENSEVSKELKDVLYHLCHLYLFYNICQQSGLFMRVGLTETDLDKIHSCMLETLSLLRPNAVALTDAFDFHDVVLDSALGSYDGNVYERLYDLVQKAPLNQKQVHESYYKYLQPVMKSKL